MRDPLTQIQYQVEDEGLTPGSPEFAFRALSVKVERCMMLHGVTLCSACVAYLDCKLTREHARWKAFGPPQADK